MSPGAPAPTADPPRPDERRVSRLMVLLLLVSIAAGVGLLILYALGGQVQLEGALLFIALSGVGFSLILWGKYLFPPEIVTEPRGEHESSEAEQLEAERTYLEGEREISRRSMLVRLLVGAFGALGLAAIFPIRSLGPSPGRTLFQTAWTSGTRLVDAERGADPAGRPGPGRRGDRVPRRGHATRRLDGHPGARRPGAARPARRAATRTPPRATSATRSCARTPGCPVGLYLAETHQLQCPCHYSAFDVLNGAQPTFGPAARPLPQLPLEVDDERVPGAPRATSPRPSGRGSGTGVTDRDHPRGRCGGSTSGWARPASRRSRCARSSPTTGRSCWARSRCTASSSWSLTGMFLTFFYVPDVARSSTAGRTSRSTGRRCRGRYESVAAHLVRGAGGAGVPADPPLGRAGVHRRRSCCT